MHTFQLATDTALTNVWFFTVTLHSCFFIFCRSVLAWRNDFCLLQSSYMWSFIQSLSTPVEFYCISLFLSYSSVGSVENNMSAELNQEKCLQFQYLYTPVHNFTPLPSCTCTIKLLHFYLHHHWSYDIFIILVITINIVITWNIHCCHFSASSCLSE